MMTDDELLHMWLAAGLDDVYSFPEYKRIMMRQMEENDDDTAQCKQDGCAMQGVRDADG